MDRDHPTEMIPMPAVSEFEVVLRGYDRTQVRETVERLAADVRIALTDRDAAVSRSSDLASQLSAVHAEMESLRRKLATAPTPTYETMGERIANMLRLAEEEAAEIRRTAHTDAAAMREEIQGLHERASAQVKQSAENSERMHAAAERDTTTLTERASTKAKTLVADAERTAAGLVRDAEATRDRIASQSEQRAKRADEDFEISLRARRTETGRVEAERLRTSTEDANRRVVEAKATAHELVAAAQARHTQILTEAEQQRQQIDALRRQAFHQLRQVRDLLADLPPETAPEKAGAAAVAPRPGTGTPGTGTPGTGPSATAQQPANAPSTTSPTKGGTGSGPPPPPTAPVSAQTAVQAPSDAAAKSADHGSKSPPRRG